MAESGNGVGEVVCSGEFPTGVKMNGVDDNGRPVGISDIDSTQLKIADFTDYRQEKIEQQLEKNEEGERSV